MTKQSSIRTLSAGSIGNFGEIYDFAVFGFSVPILSALFFPGSDRTAALLSTFAVYAVAFFARPLGGLLFGVMADKVGRVKVMAMTVWLMALGTAVSNETVQRAGQLLRELIADDVVDPETADILESVLVAVDHADPDENETIDFDRRPFTWFAALSARAA